MNEIEISKKTNFPFKNFKILIRIMNKSLSLDVPGDWTISKIRKFLESQFQEQTKNSNINFIYSGKQIQSDDIISEIVNVL